MKPFILVTIVIALYVIVAIARIYILYRKTRNVETMARENRDITPLSGSSADLPDQPL
ncbi:hypothetical protein [Chitinophaga tropicalis]|uniref:CcmD family protein n=1 Tax=Chitinophaga tropicalis TaxID=2683588 RepID=A0A7K1U287_9BACT|nr:hypothetical protein [Chitinophaga tropicalis]MVT08471.1 hypothetical protein [Chitinophaga tropicalis]